MTGPRETPVGSDSGPSPQAGPSPQPASRRLPGRGPVVLLALLGAALLAVSTMPVWVTGAVRDPVLGVRELTVLGRAAAPAAMGLGLVGLAAAAVAGMSGGFARIVAGVLLTGAGLGAGALTIRVLLDPDGALAAGASAALGRAAGQGSAQAAATPWPWLALLGAAVTTVAGVLVLLCARAWARAGARDVGAAAPPGRAETARAETARAARGTGSEPDADRSVPSQPDREGGAGRGVRASRPARPRTCADDWDSLSRGEDPTA